MDFKNLTNLSRKPRIYAKDLLKKRCYLGCLQSVWESVLFFFFVVFIQKHRTASLLFPFPWEEYAFQFHKKHDYRNAHEQASDDYVKSGPQRRPFARGDKLEYKITDCEAQKRYCYNRKGPVLSVSGSAHRLIGLALGCRCNALFA